MGDVTHARGESPTVTPEAIATLRRWIGIRRPARGWNSTVSTDAIWHFAAGVGDDNPLWWDKDYCTESPAGAMAAPPTFLYTCNNAPELPGESRMHPAEHWLPGARTMWLSDRWEFLRPAYVGESITATEELVDVNETLSKSGRPVVTHTDLTTFAGDDDTVIARCYKTVLRTERGNSDRTSEVPQPRYTSQDLTVIASQYDAERANRRGPQTRYGDDVRIGDGLGELVKGPMTTTSIVGWVMGWGLPMAMTNRMQHDYLTRHPASRLVNDRTNVADSLEAPHWDAELARQSGLPRGYDFGPQRISWAAHLLTDWMSDSGFLSDLEVRLLRPNLVGDTTWISGGVRQVDRSAAGTWRVSCTLSARNQRDEQTLDGTAIVRLPSRSVSG